MKRDYSGTLARRRRAGHICVEFEPDDSVFTASVTTADTRVASLPVPARVLDPRSEHQRQAAASGQRRRVPIRSRPLLSGSGRGVGHTGGSGQIRWSVRVRTTRKIGARRSQPVKLKLRDVRVTPARTRSGAHCLHYGKRSRIAAGKKGQLLVRNTTGDAANSSRGCK